MVPCVRGGGREGERCSLIGCCSSAKTSFEPHPCINNACAACASHATRPPAAAACTPSGRDVLHAMPRCRPAVPQETMMPMCNSWPLRESAAARAWRSPSGGGKATCRCTPPAHGLAYAPAAACTSPAIAPNHCPPRPDCTVGLMDCKPHSMAQRTDLPKTTCVPPLLLVLHGDAGCSGQRLRRASASRSDLHRASLE